MHHYLKMPLTFLFVSCLASCAQLPPSSVTLSNSIGTDIAAMESAHKDLVNYYFDSQKQRVNDFIDNTYRPNLLKRVIEQDVERFKNPAQKNTSLFNAIQKAFIPSELEKAQANALAGMKIFYTKIDEQVETKRSGMITPLNTQQQQLLSSLNANYANITNKNSVITALLSSIVDVQETQQELLRDAGVDKDLRSAVGASLSKLGDEVTKLQSQVDSGSAKVEDIEQSIDNFKDAIK